MFRDLKTVFAAADKARPIRIAIDSVLDSLQEIPATRNMPGVRYLKLRELDDFGTYFTGSIDLPQVRSDDVKCLKGERSLTLKAPRYHENGEFKSDSEWSTGYGTWRRRYRIPSEADLDTLQIVPGKRGVEVVIRRRGDTLTA